MSRVSALVIIPIRRSTRKHKTIWLKMNNIPGSLLEQRIAAQNVVVGKLASHLAIHKHDLTCE